MSGIFYETNRHTFRWSERKEIEKPIFHPGLTMRRAARLYCEKSTRRKLYDWEHSTLFQLSRYALAKLKGHGIIRINYMLDADMVRLIDAFDANQEDTERYYTGDEDW